MITEPANRSVDVCVLGGGTSGLNVAYQFARRGRSVVIVERREAAKAGAQWVNGVLPWQFERADLDPPHPPELFVGPRVNHMCGPDGAAQFVLLPGPIHRAKMPLLSERLRALALDSGAELMDETVCKGFETALGRPVAAHVERDGQRFSITASLFVDTTGRAAVLRNTVDHFTDWCPPLGADELCLAGDYHHRIADSDGALAFLARIGAEPGDHINRVGRYGGWSTESYRVDPSLESVDLLIGAVASESPGTVPELFERVLAEQPWIGERTGGGSGFIPLRRPYARLTAPGAALVGDAACQVFSAHGSGVGMGLMAGTMLAAATDGSADCGDPAVLWTYQYRFWKAYGPRLVAYDLFRRMSTGLGGEGVERLMAAEVMSPSSTAAAMDQRWEVPPLGELLAQGRRLRSDRRLAAFVTPALARITLGQQLAARVPKRPSLSALARWSSTIDRLAAQQDAVRFRG